MSKGEEFSRYAYENRFRFIGWHNDEITRLYLDAIKEDVESYTKMLIHASTPQEVFKYQAVIQVLQKQLKLTEGLFDLALHPDRPEEPDDADEL